MYEVNITSKTKISCTIANLVEEFNALTPSYLKHIYDTGHQLSVFKDHKITLSPNETLVIIDFSQSYIFKCDEEIQDAHFGASQRQLSLYTGVYYYKDEDGNIVCVSFCTVSEDLRHGAAAVWAHLKPVFDLIKKTVPSIEAVHIQSDGPTTQYENETKFFFTPGHGEKSVDAIGGTVKSICDRYVLCGKYVVTINDVTALENSECRVHLFRITTSDMESVDSCVHPKLKSLPNSNKIFQLIWKVDDCNSLFMNSSYLECMNRPPCPHFSLKPNKYTFPVHQRQSTPEVDIGNLTVLPLTPVTRKTSKKRAQAGSEEEKASPKRRRRKEKIDCDCTFLFLYEVQQMFWKLKFV
ncbi:hypothetical protein QAD02_008695 [Eretmocerus hayati]|uniref:Uncharacterized protein n=1 Tax=Eretmocerus hayati TaxID=131215 RepID=A0ACC2N7T4_9HYME|nr:hypothetical protein QAD02_008695 [Eretmocerus hayati]